MRISQLPFLVTFVFAGVLGWPGEAAAWGQFGHLTVCDLAYRNLTPATRTELRRLLEEDEHPRRHPKDHFINVDRETKAISTNACPGNADCILSGIERDIAILKDTTKSNQERVFALMAL